MEVTYCDSEVEGGLKLIEIPFLCVKASGFHAMYM